MASWRAYFIRWGWLEPPDGIELECGPLWSRKACLALGIGVLAYLPLAWAHAWDAMALWAGLQLWLVSVRIRVFREARTQWIRTTQGEEALRAHETHAVLDTALPTAPEPTRRRRL